MPNADHSAWCMMSKALSTVISYVYSKYLPLSESLRRQSSVAFCPTFRVCGFIPRRINGGEWGEQTGEPLLLYVTSFSEAIVSCILANILTLYEALLRACATTPTVYVHVAIRTTLQRKWQWQRQRQGQDHSYNSRLFTYSKSEASGQWRTQMMQTMRMSGLRHSEKTSFQTMICWRIHGALSRDIVSNTCHFHTSTPYVPSL